MQQQIIRYDPDKATKNKQNLFHYFEQDISLHFYSIGDLDDFFFPLCTWYVFTDKYSKAIVLKYTFASGCAVMALASEGQLPLLSLGLEQLFQQNQFPSKFYLHYNQQLLSIFTPHIKKEECKFLGLHLKMELQNSVFLQQYGTTTPTGLLYQDAKDWSLIQISKNLSEKELLQYKETIQQFYNENNSENYFDQRMLETGTYFIFQKDNSCACVVGTHVYSEEYKVVGLGNILTGKNFRKKGFAKAALVGLLQFLLKTCPDFCICLNVLANNEPAIQLYQQLGFVSKHEFEEALLVTK